MKLDLIIKDIEQSEGFSPVAYKDKLDVWTIGYGSTYDDQDKRIKEGDTITRERAEQLLRYKLEHEYLPQLNGAVKVPLNDNQKSALLSLIYNIGIGNFTKSRLLTIINNNPNNPLIKNEWLVTCIRAGSKFEKGLRNRRKREVELYFK